MEAEFWHARWQEGRIGFHEGRVNRMLAAHVAALGLKASARVFVPLCGKAADIPWLVAQGYCVTGVELSEIAVRALFDAMGVEPVVAQAGVHRRYAGGGVEVFAGDLFALAPEQIGAVDAIYDRAALVALPATLRARYADHLVAVSGRAPQLLVTFEYDQTAMEGPPFSVDLAEIRALYGACYDIAVLADEDVPGGLKSVCPARETAVLLRPL